VFSIYDGDPTLDGKIGVKPELFEWQYLLSAFDDARKNFITAYPSLNVSTEANKLRLYTKPKWDDEKNGSLVAFLTGFLIIHVLFIVIIFIVCAFFLISTWTEWDFSISSQSFRSRTTSTFTKTVTLQELTRKRKVEKVWEIYNNPEIYDDSYLHLLSSDILLQISDIALGENTDEMAATLEHGPK